MKAWFFEHKFYVFAGIIIALAGLYYYFFYQETPNPTQQTIEMDKSIASTNADEKQNVQPAKPKNVMVDVKGEIKQPGVYTSSETERVIDVIQRAGGLTDKADKSQVNFAAHVQDAMIIYIPAKGEAVSNPAANHSQTAAASPSAGNSSIDQNGKININNADSNELQNLPGIGPAKADAIIQFRTENGPYQKIEDLKNISGIGDKTFEKLKELITIQ